jgi:hypothetical protein
VAWEHYWMALVVARSGRAVAHRRFSPSSVGHDLGTDRAMPASVVHAPARAGPQPLGYFRS